MLHKRHSRAVPHMTHPLVSVRHMIPLHFKTHNLINSYVVSTTRTPSFLHPIKRYVKETDDPSYWGELTLVTRPSCCCQLLTDQLILLHFTMPSPVLSWPYIVAMSTRLYLWQAYFTLPESDGQNTSQSRSHPPGSVSCFAPSWSSNICFIGVYLTFFMSTYN